MGPLSAWSPTTTGPTLGLIWIKCAAPGAAKLKWANNKTNPEFRMKAALLIATVLATGATFLAYAAADAAAEALARKSKCLTCHSVDKKKEGPSFKETAAKYKGKPDAEQKLFTHLASRSLAKLPHRMRFTSHWRSKRRTAFGCT